MSMYPIATASPTTGGIIFSSIPQTFTHLQLRIFSRSSSSSAGASVSAGFNSDGGSNYAYHYVGGNGASTFSGAATTQTSLYFGWSAGTTDTANVFSNCIVDILDYTNTNKYKTAKTLTGIDSNGSGLVGLWSGLWMSTSAITSITINPNNFASGSTVQLYGIQTSNATGA